MSTAKSSPKPKKLKDAASIEITSALVVTPCKLDVGETRLILKCSNQGVFKAYYEHSVKSLEDMGILRKLPADNQVVAIEDLWGLIESRVIAHDLPGLKEAIEKMDDCNREAEALQYVLTDLGNRIADKLLEKLDQQFPKKAKE